MKESLFWEVKMAKKILGWTVALMPIVGAAQTLGYDYVELGYVGIEPDMSGAESFDGYQLTASMGFGEHWFGELRHRYLEDDADFQAEVYDLSAGLGFRQGITDGLDVLGGIAYQKNEIDVIGQPTAEEEFATVSLGTRYAFNDWLEVNLTAIHAAELDLTDYVAGMVVSLWGPLNLSASYLFAEEADGYTVGLRGYY